MNQLHGDADNAIKDAIITNIIQAMYKKKMI